MRWHLCVQHRLAEVYLLESRELVWPAGPSPTYMLISNHLTSPHLTSPQSLPSLHPGKPDQHRLWTSKYHREQDTVTSASVLILSFSAFQNWKTEFSEFEEGEEAWHGWHHPRSPFGRWMMAHYCQWNQQYSKYSTQIFTESQPSQPINPNYPNWVVNTL